MNFSHSELHKEKCRLQISFHFLEERKNMVIPIEFSKLPTFFRRKIQLRKIWMCTFANLHYSAWFNWYTRIIFITDLSSLCWNYIIIIFYSSSEKNSIEIIGVLWNYWNAWWNSQTCFAIAPYPVKMHFMHDTRHHSNTPTTTHENTILKMIATYTMTKFTASIHFNFRAWKIIHL